MLERTVTDVATTVGRDHRGFNVHLVVRYVESDMAGGRMKRKVDRYDALSRDELIQLLFDIAEQEMPGDPTEASHQLSMSLIS